MEHLPATEIETSRPSTFVWRAVGFVALFVGLQLGWQALHGSAIERVVIHDLTVRPAAFLVNFLTPGAKARAVDFSIRASGGGLNILNGCDGMELLLMLLAGFTLAPLSAAVRVRAIVLGILFVFAVNQARILLLFYAYRADPRLFDTLHATITPIATVLLIAGYYHAWHIRASSRTIASA
jgi:exosortase/archaeosortase family protein